MEQSEDDLKRHQKLQNAAWRAEVAFTNLIDLMLQFKVDLAALMETLPDITGGLIDNALKAIDQAIAALDDLRIQFFLQRAWGPGEWTWSHLLGFEAGVIAKEAALAVVFNGAAVAVGAFVPSPIGPALAPYLGVFGIAHGEALGVVALTFSQENTIMVACGLNCS